MNFFETKLSFWDEFVIFPPESGTQLRPHVSVCRVTSAALCLACPLQGIGEGVVEAAVRAG